MKIHGARPRTDPALIATRLAELEAAFQAASDAMHKFDGTQPDAGFGTFEMRQAAVSLQTAWFWAKEAIERN